MGLIHVPGEQYVGVKKYFLLDLASSFYKSFDWIKFLLRQILIHETVLSQLDALAPEGIC